MHKNKICLASDNWSSAHPLVLKALVEANEGYAPAYGTDRWTEEAQKRMQEIFRRDCKVAFIPTGTGSNVFALKLACRPFESVICTDIAHIHFQESGAAEAVVGCKLLTVPHRNGKLLPADVLKKLASERAFGKHSTSPRVLSITQPTEVGTVYSLEELNDLSALCAKEGLLLHIDGSRLYNAAVHLNAPLHAMIDASSADILSLGGTKNGLMGAEALLIFNPALQVGSDHLQKQTLQLLSKMRYLSAQYIPFFTNNLWHTLAAHANQKAHAIAKIIETMPSLSLSYPVDTNQLFFTAPPAAIPLIQEHILCHVWNKDKGELRFITSWNTSDDDVKSVESVFKIVLSL